MRPPVHLRLGLLAAALWWGSLSALSFVVVPMLFMHLQSPAAAGAMAARLFGAQTWISSGCAMLMLVFFNQKSGYAQDMRVQAAMKFIVSGMLLALLVEFAVAPRIVATQEGRVLLSRGDRAYARGEYATGGAGKALSDAKGQPLDYRVFRNAVPLKDPTTGAILGYEAQFVGKAELVRGESTQQVLNKDGKTTTEIVPATIDIVVAKEEMRVGDRLVPEPARTSQSYMPRAPGTAITGQIVSVYGSAVRFAAENQVVVVNRGTKDGLEAGHVMAILKDGERLTDRTDNATTQIKLPNERNGLLMVFRTYENLSYALVLQITDGVKVGDRIVNPK